MKHKSATATCFVIFSYLGMGQGSFAVDDIDFYLGTGAVSAKTDYTMKFDETGAAEKARTDFLPYAPVINLGIRYLHTREGPVAGIQIGGDLSYFGGTINTPANRIIESSNSGKVNSVTSQNITAADGISFYTGRGSFYLGIAIPISPSFIVWEMGGMAGFGLGRVADLATVVSNGRSFSAYSSVSAHAGLLIRFRIMLKTNTSITLEYRYLEEKGANLSTGSDWSKQAATTVFSNLFLVSLGYRFNIQ